MMEERRKSRREEKRSKGTREGKRAGDQHTGRGLQVMDVMNKNPGSFSLCSLTQSPKALVHYCPFLTYVLPNLYKIALLLLPRLDWFPFCQFCSFTATPDRMSN